MTLVSVSASGHAAAAIDGNVTNQVIRGFGASSAWNSQATLAPAAATMWAVDNLDGHVGMSILRTRIDPGGAFANEAGPMTLAKAQNPNMIIWSTMWTPPAAYKNNNSLVGPGANNTFNNTPANSTAYANYLVNYIKAIKTNYGIDLYCVSPQNEPDWNTSYESCIWTAAQFNDFVKNYLGPAITAAGLSTKIMIPESFSDNLSMAATAMNDAVTAPMISIIGNHLYGGGPRDIATAGWAHLTNQESWETEMSDVSGASHDPGMAPALQIAAWIHSCMVTANMNAYLHWWIYAYGGSNEGLYGVDTTTPTKKLYIMGNFSKFVRPGWYRMGGNIASGATGVSISAYKDKAGAAGSFAIVAINSSGSAVNQTFNLSNLNGATAVPWVTDASNNLVHKATINIVGNSFSYSLPAQSVVTFLCSGPAGSPTFTPTYAGTSTRTPTPSPTPQSQLFDDFEDLNTTDNWGGSWFTYAGTGSSVTLTVAGPGGPTSTLGRAQMSGNIADYGGIGANFNTSPRDLSSYVGISFKVRGSGSYWFQLNQANIADGDNFGATFTATGTWTTVTIYFNGLTQRGFGATASLDLTQIANLQWASNANGTMNFELDDVQLLTYSLPTATNTPTRTRTATPTPSPSSSATRTVTGTPSSSPTATASITPNATSTASVTPSATRSTSPTSSATPTRTATVPLPTSTPTATPSATASVTLSGTASHTPSPAATGTFTRSITPTFSGTATRTSLPTLTASATVTTSATPSESRTATVAITPSVTDTVTDGPSSTASVTPSQTALSTFSSTVTASLSPSVSRSTTPSPSATSSLTDGPSPTSSPTLTATPSRSMTPSATTTATCSVTATRTCTTAATATSSSTPGTTATATATPTPSGTLTALPTTAIPTVPSTATRTTVPTAIPTATTQAPTSTPAPNGALQVLAAAPVPNPNPAGIAVQLAGPADNIAIKIYSSANTLLFEADSGSTVGGWTTVKLPNLGWLPNGTYFYSITAWRSGKTSPAFPPGRFTLLR